MYRGKIAYRRRRTEKKIGTRNELYIVEKDEFQTYNGQQEATVSEEDWNVAQSKKKKSFFRRDAFVSPPHAHILFIILICYSCGKKMYGNVSKAHSKDDKTRCNRTHL